MSWALLLLGGFALVNALNALAPRKGPGPLVMVWSFFSSWLTIELAWHHLVGGVVIGGFAIAGGLHEEVPGLIGLILLGAALAVLVTIIITTRRTVLIMRGALADVEPGPEAPRFPRSAVVLPFLLGRRKGVKTVRNVKFRRAAGKTLRLDVTVPSAPAPGGGQKRPALMQIHGGAWVIGDKREQGLPLLRHMAAQGWVGFNVNYRLSPGATFPEHLEDLEAGLAWIREHADDYGIDPDFVCVTGGSAGGHLSSLLALSQSEHVAGAVPFYGVYDFTAGGAFGADPEIFRKFLEPMVMKAFVDEEPERYEAASPTHRVHPGAPPFFVIHGDRDTLAPVEDARTFVEKLRAVSDQPVLYAEMKGAQHAFEIFPSPRAAKVIEGVERFLSKLWEEHLTPGEPETEELEEAVGSGR